MVNSQVKLAAHLAEGRLLLGLCCLFLWDRRGGFDVERLALNPVLVDDELLELNAIQEHVTLEALLSWSVKRNVSPCGDMARVFGFGHYSQERIGFDLVLSWELATRDKSTRK